MKLPASVQEFVRRQTTVPSATLWNAEPNELSSPYGAYWYRAVACLLLSGRISPKHTGHPNMTDVNRVGKEANFNRHLTERVGKFLVAGGVVGVERYTEYREGPRLADFWARDPDGLRELSQEAVARLVDDVTGWRPWRTGREAPSSLIELLTLFFVCFKGLALREAEVGPVVRDFAALPEEDLARVGKGLALEARGTAWSAWRSALNAKGQQAVIDALATAEWFYWSEHRKTGWVFPSPTGLAMLGLEQPLPLPELATVFEVSSNNCVHAGTGLPLAQLLPLFRHCVIKKIQEVCEFEVTRRRLAETSAGTSPGEELRRALAELEPLPDAVADLLGTKSTVGGTVGIRWCSALVKPANADVLAAIRAHPQLKGYLEAGAPPGYLLIKPGSRPDNFVRRCQGLGFTVEQL